MLAVELPRSGVARAVLDRGRQIVHGDVAAAIAEGSALMRTADCAPNTATWLTPGKNADPLAHLRVGVVVQLPFGHRVAGQARHT